MLTRRPDRDVVITIAADAVAPEDAARGARTVLPSAGGGPAAGQIQLVFTPANWMIPQTVTVTAVDDPAAEGQHFTNLGHTVLSRDVVTGLVSSAAAPTTFVVPVTGLVNGSSTDLRSIDLRSARLEIVRGGAVVRTRIVGLVDNGNGTVTFTVLDPWPAGRTPQLADEYRITVDDAVRGVVDQAPVDTIFAENVNLGLLGDVEIGQQLRDRWVRIQPAGGAAHWAQIVWATRDSLALVGLLGAVAAGDTFSVVVAPGSTDLYVLVDGDGNPIAAFAADGSPLANTISGAVITAHRHVDGGRRAGRADPG